MRIVFVLLLLAALGCSRSAPSDNTASPSGNETPPPAGSPVGTVNPKVHVKGYTKSDGAYVAPHDRASPGFGKKK